MATTARELAEAVLQAESIDYPARRENITRTFAATTAAQEVLQANPNRTQIVFVNPTANTVHVDTTPDVTTTTGFPVPPNDGVHILRFRDEGEDIYSRWFAIASAASTIGRTAWERSRPRRVA